VDKTTHTRLLTDAQRAASNAEAARKDALDVRWRALKEHDVTRTRVLELTDVERAVDEHERELSGIRARTATRLAKIAEQRARLAEVESRLAALTADVAQIRRRGAIAKQGKQVLDGCKPEVLAGALPVLNGAASYYSDLLTDGALRVAFDLFRESRADDLIRVSGETAQTYAGLSAGEKRRADLIIVLARRALARWRIGEPINLSLWDEVLEPLDESGLHRAMAVLQQDMSELESVFLISHRPEVRELFPSATTWTVVREGGVSRLVR
jgi:DNA repair exonuclease SbcCD ATPase subunit